MKKDKSIIKEKIVELCEDDIVLKDFLIELVDFESGKGGQFRKFYERVIETFVKDWRYENEN